MFLEKINTPGDVKRLSAGQLRVLCQEVRGQLISTISRTGGHLASNLGTVELTVALHKVFSSPTDQIVWDVGHQCYTHKLLTGRRDAFHTLRTQGGLSGFPKRRESVHDAFVAGHSGNSISAALGLLTAKGILGEDGHVVAVIGDGSFTNGLAYEGFNNAGRSLQKLIVILNDNEMSISANVGALAKYLSKIRAHSSYFKLKDVTEATVRKIPVLGEPIRDSLSMSKALLRQMLYHSNLFEDFGFAYLGPVDGHNIESLCDVLARAKAIDVPVIVHVETKKGKGYLPAERNPKQFHGVSRFDIRTGQAVKPATDSFSSIFGEELTALARRDSRICAISAAMVEGTGLSGFFEEFGGAGRCFDVGIAEGHALTFGAGLASKGLVPVFAVYSTFLQRTYDQLIHDCAIEGQHVVLGVDRAGIVGEDGETHQGLFDVAFLSTIPGMTIYSPSGYEELRLCLQTAVNDHTGLVAVRYPRGREAAVPAPYQTPTTTHLYWENDCKDTLLVTYGRLFSEAVSAAQALEKQGRSVSICKLAKILPLDAAAVEKALGYRQVLFLEEGILQGSVAQQFGFALLQRHYRGDYQVRGVDSAFVPQSTVPEALHSLGLSSGAVCAYLTGEGRQS